MKDINDLRAALFDIIAGVRDGSIDIEKANTVKGLADSIIDTGKIEVAYCKATGANCSGFIDSRTHPVPEGILPAAPHALTGKTHVEKGRNGGTREVTTATGVTRTVHTMGIK